MLGQMAAYNSINQSINQSIMSLLIHMTNRMPHNIDFKKYVKKTNIERISKSLYNVLLDRISLSSVTAKSLGHLCPTTHCPQRCCAWLMNSSGRSMLEPGGTAPKSWPGPQFFQGNLRHSKSATRWCNGSIVISLSRCCLPNDEGPGPQVFFLEPPLMNSLISQDLQGN